METQIFKLSKTGKIIIIIAIVVVILMGLLWFIASKKQQEIKQENPEAETKTPEKQEVINNFSGVIEGENLHKIFDDYRAGKYTSREAIKLSGLSNGTFYRNLKKYESK